MDNEYFTEGYTLMIQYMKEEKILTRERNFRQRLERWYNKNKNKKIVIGKDEKEYLHLEKYFYNNILIAKNKKEKALTNMLNILSDADYEKKK